MGLPRFPRPSAPGRRTSRSTVIPAGRAWRDRRSSPPARSQRVLKASDLRTPSSPSTSGAQRGGWRDGQGSRGTVAAAASEDSPQARATRRAPRRRTARPIQPVARHPAGVARGARSGASPARCATRVRQAIHRAAVVHACGAQAGLGVGWGNWACVEFSRSDNDPIQFPWLRMTCLGWLALPIVPAGSGRAGEAAL